MESYHVDFLRNEWRNYARTGESFVTGVAFEYNGIATEFSDAVNRRVQAGQATYADFVRDGAAAGCAYYIVYVGGKKVRYLGRNGREHVQHFPARGRHLHDTSR